MTLKKIMLGTLITSLIFIGLVISILFFTWRTDVSKQEPYVYFINTGLDIKQPYSIVREKGRFKDFALRAYSPSVQNELIEKVYKPGDLIQFYAAKSYYSLHVSKNYYLIGRDTLPSGKVIEFEYFMTEYEPRIWETLEEFLERKGQ